MDNTEDEKLRLLESIKLQEAALSATVDSSIITFDSDSDLDEESTTINTVGTPADDVSSVCQKEEVRRVLEDDADNLRDPHNPSWAEALSANMEYDSVLAQVEIEIKQNILKVSRQLDEVQSQICSASTEGPAVNIKSHWLYVFGMPYFKDNNFYPCPFNEDYVIKQKNREICWSYLPRFHQWIGRHKKILHQAVRELSLEKCKQDAQFKLAVLRKELAAVKLAGDEERAAILENQAEEFDVEAEAESRVNDVIENGEHDWMQISARYLEGKHSPDGCRSFWYSYLHPAINKAPYTEEEEIKLTSLVDKYKHQDWDEIAKELGTNRSGYQCFIVYQNKLNTSLRRNTWEAEEDKKLLQIVEECRIGEYIPWGKVAYHMDRRTKTQVFNRWTYSINPGIKKGRFTKEEDIMILVGVQMWGEDFQRISNFIKERTTCQVRDRYKHYLGRPGLGVAWTIDDDQLLFRLTDKYGKNWSKISEHFPCKDRTQVRHRYGTLANWRMKNPDAPLTDAPSRCYNPQKYKDFQEQWERAKSILRCETVDEMVKAKNALVSSFMKRKKTPDCVKRKKPSVFENDLVNYFRCSFDIPGGRRKTQLKMGEAKKYADELRLILPLLKSNLNLPSIAEIMMDSSLSASEKEILKTLLSSETDPFKNDSPDTSSDCDILESATANNFHDLDNIPAPFFCDVQASKFPLETTEPATDIDYVPTHDISSLYIDLPLMNFSGDEVVADMNQDPTFFEPATLEPILNDQLCRNNVKSKESYMCPPNLTTLVGMRTYLLNRRTLLAWCNEDPTCPTDVNNMILEEARRKFDQRLLFLFLWPALMSRYGPITGSIYDDDDTESKGTAKKRPRPKSRPKSVILNEVSRGSKVPSGNIQSTSSKGLSVERALVVDPAVPSTSGPPQKRRKTVILNEASGGSKVLSGNTQSTASKDLSVEKALVVDPAVPSTSGPPQKRRKIIVQESDDDPDDPDIM